MAQSIKEQLTEDMKAAMRAKDSARLGVIRLVNAAIKQREVDERIQLDDAQVLAVLDKMVKQRRESISQFEAAARQDLVDKEAFELGVLQEYMPAALDEADILAIVDQAIASSGAASVKDMGGVMNLVRPQVQGRADMSKVSALVKDRLAAN